MTEDIKLIKTRTTARSMISGYEGYQWKYMTAEKNPMTGDWLIEDKEKGVAFYVKSKKAALNILRFVKMKRSVTK